MLNYESISEEKQKEIESQFNFLFLVHNDIEFCEMYSELLPPIGEKNILSYVDNNGNKQVYFLGKFGHFNIVLTKASDMGSIMVNASINVVNNAIDTWHPIYVLMIGIAAAISNKCKIGDVVVSRQVVGYEAERVGRDGIIGRYPILYSGKLYNLYDNIMQSQFDSINYERFTCLKKVLGENLGSKIRKGILLSGEKLLDDPDYRKILQDKFPEAIALDMEGIGVASASINKRIYDWIIVKGISDFGDGNKSVQKDDCQTYAMSQAIKLTKIVFSDVNNFSEKEFKVDFNAYKNRNVLISGSQVDNNNDFSLTVTENICSALSSKLIEDDFRVVTGYGREIGQFVVNGVFSAVEKKFGNINEVIYDKYIACYPFPRAHFESSDEMVEEMKRKNRLFLTNNIKIAIFLFGYKYLPNSEEYDSKVSGMDTEFKFVEAKGAFIVPVGATGGKSKELWEKVNKKFDKYYSKYNNLDELKAAFDKLNENYNFNDINEIERLIDNIINFIKLR